MKKYKDPSISGPHTERSLTELSAVEPTNDSAKSVPITKSAKRRAKIAAARKVNASLAESTTTSTDKAIDPAKLVPAPTTTTEKADDSAQSSPATRSESRTKRIARRRAKLTESIAEEEAKDDVARMKLCIDVRDKELIKLKQKMHHYFAADKFPAEFSLIQKIDRLDGLVFKKLPEEESTAMISCINAENGSFKNYLEQCFADIQDYLDNFDMSITSSQEFRCHTECADMHVQFWHLISRFMIIVASLDYLDLAIKSNKKIGAFANNLLEYVKKTHNKRMSSDIAMVLWTQVACTFSLYLHKKDFALTYISTYEFEAIIPLFMSAYYERSFYENQIKALRFCTLLHYYLVNNNIVLAERQMNEILQFEEELKRKCTSKVLNLGMNVLSTGTVAYFAKACQLLAQKYVEKKNYHRAYYYFTLENKFLEYCVHSPIDERLVNSLDYDVIIEKTYISHGADRNFKSRNAQLTGVFATTLPALIKENIHDFPILATETSYEISTAKHLISSYTAKFILYFKDALAKRIFSEVMTGEGIYTDHVAPNSIIIYDLPKNENFLKLALTKTTKRYLEQTGSNEKAATSEKDKAKVICTTETQENTSSERASSTLAYYFPRNIHARQKLPKVSKRVLPPPPTPPSLFFAERPPQIIRTWGDLRYDSQLKDQSITPLGEHDIFYLMLDEKKLIDEGVNTLIIQAAKDRVARGHNCAYSQGIVRTNEYPTHPYKVRLLGANGKGDIRIYGRLAGLAEEGQGQLIIFDGYLDKAHKSKCLSIHEPSATCTTTSTKPKAHKSKCPSIHEPSATCTTTSITTSTKPIAK